MSLVFTQTASVMTCAKGDFCGGVSDAVNGVAKQALIGGAPSAVPINIPVQAGDVGHTYVWFECQLPEGSVWNAGTWTVRLDVTTANANISWEGASVCRVSSGCVSQATIGFHGFIGINLGSTGVKASGVVGSAQTPSSGDKVIICLQFANSLGSIQSFQFTPDVNIDSPFDGPIPGQEAGRNWMYYNTLARM